MITSDAEIKSLVQDIYLSREKARELDIKLAQTLKQEELEAIKASLQEASELCATLQMSLQAIHYQALVAEKHL